MNNQEQLLIKEIESLETTINMLTQQVEQKKKELLEMHSDTPIMETDDIKPIPFSIFTNNKHEYFMARYDNKVCNLYKIIATPHGIATEQGHPVSLADFENLDLIIDPTVHKETNKENSSFSIMVDNHRLYYKDIRTL